MITGDWKEKRRLFVERGLQVGDIVYSESEKYAGKVFTCEFTKRKLFRVVEYSLIDSTWPRYYLYHLNRGLKVYVDVADNVSVRAIKITYKGEKSCQGKVVEVFENGKCVQISY